MLAAEVIGLISGLTALVSASVKICNTTAGINTVTESFRDAASRLSAIKHMLGLLEDSLDGEKQISDPTVFKQLLECCHTKAAALHEILVACVIAPGASGVGAFSMKVKNLYKAEQVERLMQGILADLHVLAANYMIQNSKREQAERLLRVASRGISNDQIIYGSCITYNNFGSGNMPIISHSGIINLNLGPGLQFNGPLTGLLSVLHL